MGPSAPVALQLDALGPGTLPLLLVVLGLGLSVAEALIPGAHFVVPGVALLLSGVVGLLVPPLAGPIALGALVVLFGAVALYGYREVDLYGGESGRTTDSDSLRGATGRVTERVTPTEGEVRVEGGGFNPHYAARSVDGTFPEGTEVIVVDPGGGNVLTVEALDPVEDEIDRELRRGRERAGGPGAGDRQPTGESRPADHGRERERERER
ncbi:MAG: NfeD family protein [Haloferacaceae archaeon]